MGINHITLSLRAYRGTFSELHTSEHKSSQSQETDKYSSNSTARMDKPVLPRHYFKRAVVLVLQHEVPAILIFKRRLAV